MEYSVPNNQTETKQTRVDRTTRVTADDTLLGVNCLNNMSKGRFDDFYKLLIFPPPQL
jgi:hypothetical protein